MGIGLNPGTMLLKKPFIAPITKFATPISIFERLLGDSSSNVRLSVPFSIGLIFQGIGDEGLIFLEALIQDKDEYIRIGASLGLALAYKGAEERGLAVLKRFLTHKLWYVRLGATLGIALAFQGKIEKTEKVEKPEHKFKPDINDDGVIDQADLNILKTCYKSRQGELQYIPEADLNQDGTIDIIDLAILASFYKPTKL